MLRLSKRSARDEAFAMEAKRRFNGKEKAGARAARVQSFVEVKSSLRQVLSSVEASGMPVDTRRSARPAVPPATRLNRATAKLQGLFASFAPLWR